MLLETLIIFPLHSEYGLGNSYVKEHVETVKHVENFFIHLHSRV